MNAWQLITVFIANFVFIGLKAAQQRNVAFLHYAWVVPTSFAMAVTEVYVVSVVALNVMRSESFLAMWPVVVAVALGGGLGCLLSMWLHQRYIK